MPDVLLVQPPIRDFYLTAKRTQPYGLASIAAGLRGAGFTVEILDALATDKSRPAPLPPAMAGIEDYFGRPDDSPFGLFHRFRHFGYSYEHLERKIRESAAPLVGISALFTPYLAEALATAAAAKRALPNCRVVVGGHHATVLPESVLASPAVDFILRGEGEASLPRLAAALKRGGDLGGIPGIGLRRPDGSLHLNPPAAVAAAADFPLPATELLHRTYYRRSGRGSAVVVASRGCPLACSYCCIGGADWLPYRRRPVDQVLTEIEAAARRQDAAFIDFEDENLSLNRPWFMALLQGIVARFGERAFELRAMNGLFPPSLDHEMLAAMHRAGFRTLNLSLGTARPEQAARFRRADVRAGFDAVLAAAAGLGMQAVGYIIVGAPFQRAADSADDLIFLAARRVLAGISVFYPAPGSPDFELCRRLGLLPADYACLRSTALPIGHTTRPLETATLLRLGRILNFMKRLQDLALPIEAAGGRDGLHDRRAAERIAAGRSLLARFLGDGRICGITSAGEIYEHRVDRPLVRCFLEKLERIRVRGVR